MDGHDSCGIHKEWGATMAICRWQLWKCRNELIFQEIILPLEQLLRKHFVEQESLEAEVRIQCTCSPVHVVKLNVDGASHGDPGLAGCGCVIRDHEGQWLVGTTKVLGIATGFHTELAAAQLGVSLVWDHGFKNVQMETDSSLVFYLLTTSSHPLSSCAGGPT